MTTPQLSRSAFDRLQAEFDDLTTRGRIEVANKIERAREEGDLKENAGYHAAKDEQGHMEGQVDGADVISPSSPLGTALGGAAAGDTISYEAPNGTLTVKVLAIEEA